MYLKIIDRSVSYHCCFAYSIVDEHDPEREPLCECFNLEDAKIILEALEKTYEPFRDYF